MSSVVFGAVGAVIGGIMGGPGGAQAGWAIGSMLGSALFPPKGPVVEGPKLSDLSVQSSTQGLMIPRVYGSARMSGNVIWSSDKRETKHEEEVGGKGGAPSQTNISYTYAVDMAVAICEGEIKGIRKIWANKNLIIDGSSTASSGSVLSSNPKFDSVRFYLGDENQMPDSVMEAALGVGSVPAYRGTAYIVFENMQLADYGNNVPQLEFEVINNAGTIVTGRTLSTASGLGFATYPDNIRITDIRDGNAKIDVIKQNPENYTQIYAAKSWMIDASLASKAQNAPSDSQAITSYAYNLLHFIGTLDGYKVYGYHGFAGNSTGPYKIQVHSPTQDVTGYYGSQVDGIAGLDAYIPSTEYIRGAIPVSGGGAIMVFTGPNSASNANKWYLLTMSGIKNQGTCNFGNTPWGSSVDYSAGSIAVGMVSNNEKELILDNTQFFIQSDGSFDAGHLLTSTFSATSVFVKTDNYMIANNDNAMLYSSGSFLSNNEGDSPTLSSIVTDLCETAGLSASDIDVSELNDDKLRGYVINALMPVRQIIEPLMQAFFFDGIESDNKIKFVKRGKDPVVAISVDEMAAFEGTTSDLPDDVSITRAQSVELPTEITVNYLDYDRDYQEGVQYSRRETEPNQNQMSHSLAMVLTPTKAKQIADVLLGEVWMSRTGYRFTTTRRYSYIEPTDVVTIQNRGKLINVRISKKVEGQNGIIDWEGVEEDASIYNSNATAATSLPIQQEVAHPSATILRMMDMPILRDSDNNYGMYVAMGGLSGSWTGGGLYSSVDNLTFTTSGVFLNSASVMGLTSNELGTWNPEDNRFDEINALTVKINSGSLASAPEVDVLNGANYALVGDEIIQFKTATLIATNTYLLTGLLRGRKGTEWAIDTHTDNDEFTLIQSSKVGRYQDDISRRDSEQSFKGVSTGQTVSSAYPVKKANTGRALKPYAVAHVNGAKSGSDIELTWVRRTRIGGEWMSGMDISLGEQNEKYELEIYADSAYNEIKRLVSVGSPNFLYTSAMQVQDFGSNQTTLYVRIYQISDTVGRGFVKQKQVSV